MVILQVILPTFLIVGTGYLVGKIERFDPRTLSNLTIYVLTPSLVFHRLYVSPLNLTALGRIFLYAVAIVFVMFALAQISGHLLHLDQVNLSTFTLTVALFNAGNMGLPVILFGFGEQGLSVAVVLVVSHILMTNTLGVFLAARARGNKTEALKQIFLLPGLYAIASAFLLGQGGIALPKAILQPVQLLGNAAIPVSTLILGIQLSSSRIQGDLRLTGLASAFRLLVAPALAAVLLPLFGFEGLAFRVLLVQSAMPSAVYSVILSSKFDANASLASTTVLVSTLLSALTLSGLLLLTGLG